MYSSVRWIQRYQNFEKAYLNLAEAVGRVKETEKDELLRAGLIQMYEIAIELAWKTLKDYLEEQGIAGVSLPKDVVRRAFQEEIVKDGSMWLNALEDRNKTSHIYNESMAEAVVNDINEKYFGLLKELYLFLQKEVLNKESDE